MACSGKAHANGEPCRGFQTIPPECHGCGVMQHFGFDVDYYPDELPHWQCHRCHGGYWLLIGTSPHEVYRDNEILVARFEVEYEAEEYVNWKNGVVLQ